MTDEIPQTDLAFSFFLDQLLRGKYKTIVELGTYNGRRIVNIKRIVPSVAAYGLDILTNYNKPFSWEGVNFARFDLEFFEKKLDDALIVSNGTLCYLPQDELVTFFNTIFGKGFDIAFCEPITLFGHTDSIKRSHLSYYHSYRHLLESSGFTLQSTDVEARRDSFGLSMWESRTFNLATSG